MTDTGMFLNAQQIDQMIARRPNRTYEPGRVCITEDCDTILSVYNPDERCARHGSRRMQRPLDRAADCLSVA